MKWIYIMIWLTTYSVEVPCPYGIKDCGTRHSKNETKADTTFFCSKEALNESLKWYRDFDLSLLQLNTRIDSFQLFSHYRYYNVYEYAGLEKRHDLGWIREEAIIHVHPELGERLDSVVTWGKQK